MIALKPSGECSHNQVCDRAKKMQREVRHAPHHQIDQMRCQKGPVQPLVNLLRKRVGHGGDVVLGQGIKKSHIRNPDSDNARRVSSPPS